MDGTLLLVLLLGLLLGATSILALVLALRLRSRSRSRIAVHSSIEQIREIGHLSVFKVFTKEIVTESKHDWGDIGSRYLSWILTTKKMAMVFEFQIDFRYDLRSPAFSIRAADRGTAIVRMPPCIHEVTLQDVEFYDEQQARLLPWLLPDLVNGFSSRGFTEQDRNELVAAAK